MGAVMRGERPDRVPVIPFAAGHTTVVCGLPQFDASVPRSRLYLRYLTHVMVWLNTLSFDIRDAMSREERGRIPRNAAAPVDHGAEHIEHQLEQLFGRVLAEAVGLALLQGQHLGDQSAALREFFFRRGQFGISGEILSSISSGVTCSSSMKSPTSRCGSVRVGLPDTGSGSIWPPAPRRPAPMFWS